MMLILTSEHDETTKKIIRHLHNKITCHVINKMNLEVIKNIPINSLKIVYVKSSFSFAKNISELELREINDFIHYLYKKKNIIFYGENYTADCSKEEYLTYAEQCGLMIPPYLYTNKKSELEEFIDVHKGVITKSIKSQVKFSYKNTPDMIFGCYTKKITQEDIDQIPEAFFPSFFQKLILKDYELKIFYINEKFYPGLLYSHKTEVLDIRADTSITPLPVKLNPALEEKLRRLVNRLKLRICTIDVIHGLDDNYYFLEINPSGQFGYISDGCNYNLEKIVADEFIKKYN
jgi:hypothetical protein